MSLFELCEWKDCAANSCSISKFVVARNLKELISKGKKLLGKMLSIFKFFKIALINVPFIGIEEFGLMGQGEIVNSRGTLVKDDQILAILSSNGTPLFIRSCPSVPNTAITKGRLTHYSFS